MKICSIVAFIIFDIFMFVIGTISYICISILLGRRIYEKRKKEFHRDYNKT